MDDDALVASYSLCQACVFLREVSGRHGQRYVLCRNDEIPEKYPRQPVLRCAGYEPHIESVPPVS